MNIGLIIKKVRKLKGYKQYVLAYKAGITQSHLSGIESGRKTPSLKVIELIANALDIPTPFLIFYSITEIDVPEHKKSMYKILQPHIKLIIDDIIFDTNNIN